MKSNLLFFVLLASSCFAKAGVLGNSFFIEPYIGLKTENMKLTDLSSTVTEIKTSAPSLGTKVGYRSQMGIDINLFGEIAQGKAEVTGLAEKNNFSKKAAGFQLGVNSLGFVKMYLGASFQNEFSLEESSALTAVSFSGSSYQAGLLFKVHSYFNLGVQYNLNQYTKIKGSAFSLDDRLESYYSKVDNQDYSIYLSSTF